MRPMLALLLLVSLEASAAPLLSVSSPYLSGPARLAETVKNTHNFSNIPTAAYGYVDVPLNYDQPALGTTKIFYRLPVKFDAAKPTMIYIYGGPGLISLTASLERNLHDTNIIYFDQRGTGFSAFASLEQQQNPAFYSSENSARDAERVLRALNVKKVGVYGHSYGTVVATIFAHLFPERVTGVVLEGTLFDGAAQNDGDRYRRNIIQRFFETFSEAEQRKILEWSDGRTGLNKAWFSFSVKGAMYSDHFQGPLRDRLQRLLAGPESDLADDVSDDSNDDYLDVEGQNFAAYMYHNISCQEMSLGDPMATAGSEFAGRTLVAAPDNKDAASCLEIPGMAGRLNRTYYAVKYPLTVPVTYLEGTTDGATPAINAIHHYQRVAKARAQLLLIKDGGHTPVIGNLFEDADRPWGKPSRLPEALLVQKALAGEMATAAEARSLGWSMTQK